MFTPGPWHIGMKPGPIIYDEKSNQVANMCDGLYGDEENRANARLIATAPELLEALEWFVNQIKDFGAVTIDGDKRRIREAREAVAKAKGET